MESQIEISLKLYKCRDAVKQFYGKNYKNRLIPYSDLLLLAMKSEKVSVLEALMGILQTDQVIANGDLEVLFIAACVEIMEQNKTKTNE